MVAVKYCDYGGKTSKLLLEHGADPNAVDVNGETVLFNFLNHDAGFINTNFCRSLINHGASASISASNGLTPLMLAAKSRDFNLISMMVHSHNCDINKRDAHGNTVLHHVLPCSKQILNMLIENDADVNVKNNRGIEPFDLGNEGNRRQISSEYVGHL